MYLASTLIKFYVILIYPLHAAGLFEIIKLIWFIILKGTFQLFDSFNSLLTVSNMKFLGEVCDYFQSQCRLECCDVLQSVFWYCESLPGSPLHINTKIIFSHSFPCRNWRGNSQKFVAWKYLNYLNIDTVKSVIFIPNDSRVFLFGSFNFESVGRKKI